MLMVALHSNLGNVATSTAETIQPGSHVRKNTSARVDNLVRIVRVHERAPEVIANPGEPGSSCTQLVKTDAGQEAMDPWGEATPE